jgi:hypothetical protein
MLKTMYRRHMGEPAVRLLDRLWRYDDWEHPTERQHRLTGRCQGRTVMGWLPIRTARYIWALERDLRAAPGRTEGGPR